MKMYKEKYLVQLKTRISRRIDFGIKQNKIKLNQQKKLLKKDIDIISETTDLSIEEIEKLNQ